MSAPQPHRNLLIRQLHARPRLFLAMGLALLVYLLLPAGLADRETTRLLITWNAGTGLYLILALTMVVRATPAHMSQRALPENEGTLIILHGIG